MNQKYMRNKQLQEITNKLSKEIFGKSFPYSVAFDDSTSPNTCELIYNPENIPTGDEFECSIEISDKLRKATSRQFIYSLLHCLQKYYIWWLGHENDERITISKEKVEQFIKYYEDL